MASTTIAPPPLTFAAAATTTTTMSPATSAAPSPSTAAGPAAHVAQLRLSGDDNGTAIVVGLVLVALALIGALLAARKYHQERRIRETVRMQQATLHQLQTATNGGRRNLRDNDAHGDDVRSTITQNVRREMAGTASNASTVLPGRPLGGIRRGGGGVSKSPRTPSLASGPLTPPTRSIDRGSFNSDEFEFL